MNKLKRILITTSRSPTAQLVALGSFAVAQPILSVLRNSPEFFVARRIGAAALVAFSVMLVLVPGGLAGTLVAVAARLHPKWGRRLHHAFVGVFGGLLGIQLLGRYLRLSFAWVLVAGLGLAVLLALSCRWSRSIRQIIAFLVPAPIIFVGTFLLLPPISNLVVAPRVSFSHATTIEADAPIIFVMFDELPVFSLLDDRGLIDPYRFPNLAEFSQQATWYKYASAADAFTAWAVPAVLTGKRSDGAKLPTAQDYPRNLFTLLGSSYRLEVREPVTALCPRELCGYAEPGLVLQTQQLFTVASGLYLRMLAPMRYADETIGVADPFGEFAGTQEESDDSALDVTQLWQAELQRDRVSIFRDFIAGIDGSRRVLYFQHVVLPHAPWGYFPSGLQYNDANLVPGLEEEIWVDQWLADQAHQRHLLQLRWLDSLIGDLFDRLEEVGIFNEALIVLTADHGVSFREGQSRRAISEDNEFDIALIPLMIKPPHQMVGGVSNRYAEAIDIIPTIADILDIPLPWETDGRSLVDHGIPGREYLEVGVPGKTERLDGIREGLAESLGRKIELFGVGGGDLDLFDFGEYRHLVGMTLFELVEIGEPASLVAEITGIVGLSNVQPESGFVPALIEGRLGGDFPDTLDLQVAVALNGVVGAVVPVFDVQDDSGSFVALIPEQLFRKGTNSLALLWVDDTGADLHLRPIEVPAVVTFEIESYEGEGRIVASDGKAYSLTEEGVQGAVDSVYVGAAEIHLGGWAVDVERQEPASRIVIFAGDQFVASIRPDIERLDIAGGFAAAVAESGWATQVPLALSEAASFDLRVFAISDTTAVEVAWTDAARELMSNLGASNLEP